MKTWPLHRALPTSFRFNPSSLGNCSWSLNLAFLRRLHFRFQSFFPWKLLMKSTWSVRNLTMCWFQSFFPWKLLMKTPWILEYSYLEACFNPSSLGNCSWSALALVRLPFPSCVSILLPLETAHEVAGDYNVLVSKRPFQSFFLWKLLMKHDIVATTPDSIQFQSFFLWKLLMKYHINDTHGHWNDVSILLPLETAHEVTRIGFVMSSMACFNPSSFGNCSWRWWRGKVKPISLVSILLPLETAHEVHDKICFDHHFGRFQSFFLWKLLMKNSMDRPRHCYKTFQSFFLWKLLMKLQLLIVVYSAR